MPSASAPASRQRAHERAVAAADVDDGLAAQVDRVRQVLEIAHARQRTLAR